MRRISTTVPPHYSTLPFGTRVIPRVVAFKPSTAYFCILALTAALSTPTHLAWGSDSGVASKDEAVKEAAGKDQVAAACKKLGDLTPEKFADSRKPYIERPAMTTAEIGDVDFQKYLKSLPEDLRKKESLRYDLIKEMKNQVLHLLARTTYHGKISLRAGGSFDGTVGLANEKGMLVKKGVKDRKGKNIKWKELDVAQYKNFIQYFAQLRLNVKNMPDDGDPKADAAEDYLRGAVLCDLSKDYDSAVMFVKEAVRISPATAPRAAELLLE